MAELRDVIRQIRARLRMNTTQFGVLLGVNQSQISRYELGRAIPGFVPLGRLLQLAEGVEKNSILSRFTEVMGRQKEDLSEPDALEELRKIDRFREPLWDTLHQSPASDDTRLTWWDLEFRRLMPNLADFMEAVNGLCTRQREIDSSLVQILRLWLSHDDSDTAIRECFADAAKYLDVALTVKRSHQVGKPRARGKKPA